MNLSTTRLLIGVAPAGYGVCVASYVPGMLAGRPVPALLIAVFALSVTLVIAAFVNRQRSIVKQWQCSGARPTRAGV
jgi:hypothetical protein